MNKLSKNYDMILENARRFLDTSSEDPTSKKADQKKKESHKIKVLEKVVKTYLVITAGQRIIG